LYLNKQDFNASDFRLQESKRRNCQKPVQALADFIVGSESGKQLEQVSLLDDMDDFYPPDDA